MPKKTGSSEPSALSKELKKQVKKGRDVLKRLAKAEGEAVAKLSHEARTFMEATLAMLPFHTDGAAAEKDGKKAEKKGAKKAASRKSAKATKGAAAKSAPKKSRKKKPAAKSAAAAE